MVKSVVAALCGLILTLSSGTGRADRIQLPSDPDLSIAIGSGMFFGTSSRYEFRRIQPTFLQLELTAFNRGPACRWLCRLNLYGSINPENNGLGYRDDLEEVTLKDEAGNEVVAYESGVTSARVNSGIMWAAGGGARLSILDISHLHIDVFGEFASSLYTDEASVENLDVHALLTKEGPDGARLYGGEVDLDATGLAKEYGNVTFNWWMVHTGITVAFPLRPKRLNRQHLTPFVTLGYIWFDSQVSLKVEQELLDDLAPFGVEADDIPSGKSVFKSSPTATVGARLEIGRKNAFEFNGTFIHADGVTAYLMTGSYRLRFDWEDVF